MRSPCLVILAPDGSDRVLLFFSGHDDVKHHCARAIIDSLQRPTYLSRPRCLAARRAQAQVAELVDALASGASGATRGGSSPLLGTNIEKEPPQGGFFSSRIKPFNNVGSGIACHGVVGSPVKSIATNTESIRGHQSALVRFPGPRSRFSTAEWLVIPAPQANGSRSTIVSSRSAPVATRARWQPESSSTARRYARAAAGNLFQSRTPEVGSSQPGNSR